MTQEQRENHAHRATVVQTILNLCKTCMGTGTLALPFAAQQAGVILYVLGMILITLWNLYSIQRLIDCLRLLPPDKGDARGTNQEETTQTDRTQMNPATSTSMDNKSETVRSEATALLQLNTATNTTNSSTVVPPQHPPNNTSTLGKVAWYALGPNGLYALDIMFAILLCGIIVAYEDAMLSFLHDTPLRLSKTMNAVSTCVIMTLLSVVPHMGHLARVSAMGLGVLLLTFGLIALYAGSIPMSNTSSTASLLPLFPYNSFHGVSHWFGCVAFGFGTVPLTFNMQESMRYPDKMVYPASTVALLLVAGCYIVLGLGLLLLYPSRIEGDILSLLPTQGWLPTTIRCSMTLVVLVTAPLLIVPCGELVESKVFFVQYYVDEESITHTTSDRVVPKIIVRLSICVVCTVVALCVPAFVYVLSFVGACCVALVSFVVPPLLHLVLEYKHKDNSEETTRRRQLSLALDLVMLVWGATATLITSVYTFRQLVSTSS